MGETALEITSIFTREEVRDLQRVSNVQGVLHLLTSWGLIFFALYMCAWFPNIFVVLPMMFILGGRFLALAIIMHEGSHSCLFTNKTVNNFSAKWLSGFFVWLPLEPYRKHHLEHHRYTGTEKDSDISLVRPYPCSRKELVRRFLRDLSGLSGLRRVYGHILMDLGFIEFTVAAKVIPIPRDRYSLWQRVGLFFNKTGSVILVYVLFYFLLKMLGIAWTFWVFLASYITTFSFVVRWRAIAEHARCEDSPGAVRSIEANFLEKLLFGPHFVHYHFEHHLIMNVPCYQLPRMHKMLRERKVDFECLPGYLDVLRRVVVAN